MPEEHPKKPKAMTTEAHRKRHQVLHNALDELVADYIQHTGHMPTSTTISDLMAWSHGQTIVPAEKAS